MDPELQLRHLPPHRQWREILVEEFDVASLDDLRHWRRIGSPRFRPMTFDSERGIELGAPDGPFHLCRIERELKSKALGAHDVRIDVRFHTRSQSAVDAIDGARLSILVRDKAGHPYSLILPFLAGVSPAWETQQFWVRCAPEVTSASVRLDITRPEAGIILGQIRVAAVETLPSQPRRSHQTPTQPAVNVLPDGDFETHQPRFHASGLSHWPNGESFSVPVIWAFDAEVATSGDCSLRLSVDSETTRVAWGPLDLSAFHQRRFPSDARWHLRLVAKADRPLNLTATLRTRTRQLGSKTFAPGDDWQEFSHRFVVPVRSYDELIELASAELALDIERSDSAESAHCWIDGVQLVCTPEAAPPRGQPSIDIGIESAMTAVADLSDLWQVGDEVSFTVRLVAHVVAGGDALGTLAIDVVDAWDRVVETRTTTPMPTPSGVVEERFRLKLPRGYYRVLATLWDAEPGVSVIITRTGRALAVIDSSDPVPSHNRFGLAADAVNISRRTTHLGAGWVRVNLRSDRLETRRGVWDLQPWQHLESACNAARVETIVDLLPPADLGLCQVFLNHWLAQPADSLIAVAIRPHTATTQPSQPYLKRLEVAQQALRQRIGLTLVYDYAVLRQRRASAESPGQRVPEAVAVSLIKTRLPEANEPTLETIRRYRSNYQPLWDLYVRVPIGGAPCLQPLRPGRHIYDVDTGPIQRLAEPCDPVLLASRMVRACMIRWLAGVEMLCCDAAAFSPVRSCYDGDQRRLHETDLSPRVAVVVFDLMTSLFNDARLTRWIDYPDGARVVVFDKADGQVIAALWRPFGFSPTRLSLGPLPDSVHLLDCAGVPQSVVRDDKRTIVEVNEIVRYLVASPAEAVSLTRAIDSAEVIFRPDPTSPTPATAPAADDSTGR